MPMPLSIELPGKPDATLVESSFNRLINFAVLHLYEDRGSQHVQQISVLAFRCRPERLRRIDPRIDPHRMDLNEAPTWGPNSINLLILRYVSDSFRESGPEVDDGERIFGSRMMHGQRPYDEIYALTDGCRRIAAFSLPPGNVADISAAPALLARMPARAACTARRAMMQTACAPLLRRSEQRPSPPPPGLGNAPFPTMRRLIARET